MAEDITIVQGPKELQYQSLLPQIEALMANESNFIANMANFCAAINQQFSWLWIGFYLKSGDELILGPFQGPIACTRIKKGKGVCGKAWEAMETIIVPDVSLFPGHIACSNISKSEIVIPMLQQEEFIGVLDIDSRDLNSFDDTDAFYLKKMLAFLIP
jgi:L-methionine (R)-S-oxide reductase